MRTHEQFTEYRVQRRDVIADGVVCLTLARPDGGTVPAWAPGAHIDLRLGPDPHRPGETRVRQYSLCGDPADPTQLRIAVLRADAGRGGSIFVHDRIAVGDLVRAGTPRNHFELVESPRYLFVAGGIGITPMVPMTAQAEAAGAQWALLYGGRTRASMAFRAELVARFGGDRVLIRPEDEHGLLDLAGFLGEPREGVAVYCCGPEPLLAALERHLGPWPAATLHLERFAPKEIAAAPTPGDFVVELARTGAALTVPADRTIVDVLADAGIQVPTSCREGTCGTCETAVLSGTPDHRDSLLGDEERAEGAVIMPCVSRALSPVLVLDL